MTDGLFGFLVGLAIGAGAVVLLFSLAEDDALKACAREHNIYACEFVAVPKQPDEARK